MLDFSYCNNIAISDMKLDRRYPVENKNEETTLPDSLKIQAVVDYYNTNIKSKGCNSYIYFSIGLFLEHYCNKKILLFNRVNLSNINITYLHYLNLFYINILKIYRRKLKKLNIFNFILILFLTLFFKDLIILKNFLKNKLKTFSFKKHKRTLSRYRYVFKSISNFLLSKKNISGFKIIISGKIGLAGSAKKRKWIFKNGEINTSSKKNKLKLEVFNIWTKTGVLGVKMYLTFK